MMVCLWDVLRCPISRSSRPEVFFRKGVLKICSKFAGEHSSRSVISIKLQGSFTEITLQHGCSPVNLLHIFRTPFPKNTSTWLLLYFLSFSYEIYKDFLQFVPKGFVKFFVNPLLPGDLSFCMLLRDLHKSLSVKSSSQSSSWSSESFGTSVVFRKSFISTVIFCSLFRKVFPTNLLHDLKYMSGL